ncbi:hypothetical protein Tco_0064093 [Tanacetum coccineum]
MLVGWCRGDEVEEKGRMVDEGWWSRVAADEREGGDDVMRVTAGVWGSDDGDDHEGGVMVGCGGEAAEGGGGAWRRVDMGIGVDWVMRITFWFPDGVARRKTFSATAAGGKMDWKIFGDREISNRIV